MHYLFGVLGLLLFLVLAWLPSTNRRMLRTRWRRILLLLVVEFGLGLAMLKTDVGHHIISAIGRGFEHLLSYAGQGTSFVFGNLAHIGADSPTGAPFFFSVLMPIVFVSALIGILRYVGLLTLIIRGVGWLISWISGFGRIESYNAIASLLLGQSEVFISVRDLLDDLPSKRIYTLAASAMSTVSGSILGAYMQLIDPRYVVTAIVLNLFGAFVVVSLINPYDITDDDIDVAGSHRADASAKTSSDDARPGRGSFFAMLADYILVGFKVAITVGAMLIGFIALIAMLNGIFAGIFNGTTFQDVLGHMAAPLAYLTGIPWDEAVHAGRLMATKLVSNEVVAMTELHTETGELSGRATAIVSTFLVSFANFSSIGIIAGAVRSLSPRQGVTVARFGLRLLYGATLVSFISATIVGLIY